MKKIFFAHPEKMLNILRQTPGNDGRWGNYEFFLDEDNGHFDWLLVYDNPPRNLFTDLPVERRTLVIAEPPDIKYYDRDFISQFGVIFSVYDRPDFKGKIFVAPSMTPWFYGIDMTNPYIGSMTWDQLHDIPVRPQEMRGISVVCSTKVTTLDHSRRLRFLRALAGELNGKLDVFGNGFEFIKDKAQGLKGYRYHLCLENNRLPVAWTEKIADPILAGVYPIFAGGEKIFEFFDPLGFATIDITKPRKAIAEVKRILASDPVANPLVREAMRENKRRLMNEHQIFPYYTAHLEPLEMPFKRLDSPVEIRAPKNSKYKFIKKNIRTIRNLYYRSRLWATERL